MNMPEFFWFLFGLGLTPFTCGVYQFISDDIKSRKRLSDSRLTDIQEKEDLLKTLQAIWDNDKTIYDYRGRHSKNRDGETPHPQSKGVRWLTPREISQNALRKFGRFPAGKRKEVENEIL